jgi:phosphatidylserine decarboxylase
MRKPTPGVCPEGYPLIGLSSLTTLTLAVLELTIPALAALALTVFCVYFFRDPPRVVPSKPEAAVAPADGKVILVDLAEDPLSGEERFKISIFMNVFNVHVNRSPVQGRVQSIMYIPGKYLNASLNKASADNERNMLQIDDSEGRTWTLVQIAGLVARRIVCRVEEGDAVGRGQPFGLIKFGSRVDLYLPHGYDPIISKGDKVFAGQTVLARRKRT